MKIGSRVYRDRVLNHKAVKGTVVKIVKEYTVVKWDNINGDWHYTCDQLKDLRLLDNGIENDTKQD